MDDKQDKSDKQELFKLAQSVGSGEDKYGEYDMIPLSMLRGGELIPRKVHKHPMRHIVNDSNPTPRGWYKDKHEPARRRPRPCYTEALLTVPFGGYCHVGCKFCMSGDTLVNTPAGLTRLDGLEVGNYVISIAGDGTIIQSAILGTYVHTVSAYYKLTLADGRSYNITGDHPVYVKGRGWTAVKDLYEIQKVGLESLQVVRLSSRLLDQRQKAMQCMPETALSGSSQSCQCGSSRSQKGIFGRASDLLQVLPQSNRKFLESNLQLQRMYEEGKTICQENVFRCVGEAFSPTRIYEAEDQPEIEGHDCCREKSIQGQAKIFGMENKDVGKDVQRQDGIQGIQTFCLQEAGRYSLPFQIGMGIPDSDVADQAGNTMGVRAGGVCYEKEESDLLAGFSFVYGWPIDEGDRSEGVDRSSRVGQIYDVSDIVEENGGEIRDVGSESVGRIGDIIYCKNTSRLWKLDRIEQPLLVYDIQTKAENFYANGLLVHNCYVDNGTRGYRSTGIPTVSPDYPDKMRNNISKMMVSGAAYISSFTEPFQKLEDSYHITQRLTQVMLDEGLPFFYLSRLLPPDWALEALLHDNYSYMQFSINSSNTDIYKKMSPGSYTIDEVMDSIANLTAMGVYTSVQCNPVLPGIVSLDDIVNLVKLGSEAGLRHIIFKFAEQVFSNRRILMDRLKSLKGVDKFDSYFSQKIGGVYTIDESLRVEWLDVLLEETRKLKMTMSTCYEYFDDGAAGSNLAPYYTTSDQCHGRGVPVFYRPEPGQPFQPFPCYRKGCLYCEDYGTKACNNDVLLQAKALSYKDLKDARIYEPANGWNWLAKNSCAMPGADALATIACNPKFRTDAEMWGWE